MSLMQRGAADSSAAHDAEPRQRSATVRRTLGVLGILVFILFVFLGSWQVKRLFWKLDLIARVEQRVHAAPAAAPGPAAWPQLGAATDEYRHVSIRGTFLYEMTTRVQASTELGGGFWLLTPLCVADGSIVLINRGFVAGAIGKPGGAAAVSSAPPGQACAAVSAGGTAASAVTGLLRISEPKGAFLRTNDPAGNRWFSRDVPAIAAAHGLSRVAPYFIDADASVAKPAVVVPPEAASAVDASANTAGGASAAASASASATDAGGASAAASDAAAEVPVGGLTVISFHNNHLVYAFTWYALALMVASALYWVAREERKLVRRNAAAAAAAAKPAAAGPASGDGG